MTTKTEQDREDKLAMLEDTLDEHVHDLHHVQNVLHYLCCFIHDQRGKVREGG